jgi:hypothetical protein
MKSSKSNQIFSRSASVSFLLTALFSFHSFAQKQVLRCASPDSNSQSTIIEMIDLDRLDQQPGLGIRTHQIRQMEFPQSKIRVTFDDGERTLDTKVLTKVKIQFPGSDIAKDFEIGSVPNLQEVEHENFKCWSEMVTPEDLVVNQLVQINRTLNPSKNSAPELSHSKVPLLATIRNWDYLLPGTYAPLKETQPLPFSGEPNQTGSK